MSNDKFKPCPFCGCDKINDDYTIVISGDKGNEYQNGWTECTKCETQGPTIRAINEEIQTLAYDVRDAWNKRVEQVNQQE